MANPQGKTGQTDLGGRLLGAIPELCRRSGPPSAVYSPHLLHLISEKNGIYGTKTFQLLTYTLTLCYLFIIEAVVWISLYQAPIDLLRFGKLA